MSLKHLLVHLDSAERAAERLALAVNLARRFGARLTGLFAEIQSLGPSLVARRTPDAMAKATADARAAFDARTGAAGLVTDWWALPPGEYGQVVGMTAAACRYVDLAIFGQHEGPDARVPEDLVEQVLLGCGRPVLVVPSVGHYADVGKRVLIAWNGSREAARALNDALPLVEGAQAVTVLALQEPSVGAGAPAGPPLDIAAHLRTHGVAAQYERIVKDELGLVDTLLNRSFDYQADLVVMGYGQYGLPFLKHGGSARGMVRSMLTPVLLSN